MGFELTRIMNVENWYGTKNFSRNLTRKRKIFWKIEDLIFRWTRAGAIIIPSMKYSIGRVTTDPKLIKYFEDKLRPKFYP